MCCLALTFSVPGPKLEFLRWDYSAVRQQNPDVMTMLPAVLYHLCSLGKLDQSVSASVESCKCKLFEVVRF